MNQKRRAVTANEKAVVALSALLTDIIANPATYVDDRQLLAALKRQSRLAEYSRPQSGVKATSRSTVERLSNALFEDGFAFLDLLRVNALAGLEEEVRRYDRAKRKTKKALEEELAEARHMCVLMKVDLWHLTYAFHQALKKGSSLAYASRDPALVERWTREEETLLAMFDLARRPVVEGGSETEAWLKRLRAI